MSHRTTIVNPAELGAPKGYSNGIVAPAGSRLLFVAGQIGWDEKQRLAPGDFVAQFDQALGNALAVVRAAGGLPDHVVRLTVYVVDKTAYLRSLSRIGEIYRRRMGRHFPAMAWVEVSGLVENSALVEIEATAALPPDEPAPIDPSRL
jgi:enamine deaminase RidA (YjgF/YER057c/UK114 family)